MTNPSIAHCLPVSPPPFPFHDVLKAPKAIRICDALIKIATIHITIYAAYRQVDIFNRSHCRNLCVLIMCLCGSFA
jgi:hypothetical protein